MELVVRLPYSSVAWLRGSASSVLASSDMMGVMPLPAAIAA